MQFTKVRRNICNEAAFEYEEFAIRLTPCVIGTHEGISDNGALVSDRI